MREFGILAEYTLASPMRIGHQTLAWLQAAVDAGMEDDDFTRLYPALGDLMEN